MLRFLLGEDRKAGLEFAANLHYTGVHLFIDKPARISRRCTVKDTVRPLRRVISNIAESWRRRNVE